MSVNGIIGGLPDFMADFDLQNLSRGKSIKELKEEVSPDSLALGSSLIAQSSLAASAEQQDWLSRNAANASGSGQSNVMSNNFFDLDFEVSKYIKAQMDTESIDALRAQQGALIYEMFVALDNYNGASGKMRDLKDQQTQLEASEKNLEEVRESIETQAEEAVAPKDAEGNPIPLPDTAGTGSAHSTVKVPTVTAAEVIPASAAGASAAAPALAAPQAAAAHSKPAVPSIDITV